MDSKDRKKVEDTIVEFMHRYGASEVAAQFRSVMSSRYSQQYRLFIIQANANVMSEIVEKTFDRCE